MPGMEAHEQAIDFCKLERYRTLVETPEGVAAAGKALEEIRGPKRSPKE